MWYVFESFSIITLLLDINKKKRVVGLKKHICLKRVTVKD
jgi:hypothetical protein